MRTILHVGCGGERLPQQYSHCAETRLDIDPGCNPDVVADMAHLPDGLGPFDAIYSCHSLEHLYPHDVEACLAGFFRALTVGGVAIIQVPDLEGLSPTDEVLYEAPCGPVCAADLFYGYRPLLKAHPFMAHHTGFTQATLRAALERAGFVNVKVARLPNAVGGLYSVGVKP